MSIRMFTITDKNGKRREVSEGIYRQLFGDDADVIEDGERVTVPLRMRDGQPPPIDARFIPPTMDQLREVEAAREEYISRVSNQWRGDASPRAVDDSTPRRHDVPRRATPTSTPPPRQPVTPVKDEREQAYNEYLAYLRDAWKNGTQA